ncbi:MAG: heavy-metal-associated domain-containing protein [Rikenellaceae bacterium]
MKSLLRIFAALAIMLCTVGSVEAKRSDTKRSDASKSKIESVTFMTDIDCPSCEAKIMKVLPYQRGVKDVAVNVRSKSVTVKYDNTKTSESALKSSLKRLDVKVVEPQAPKITPKRK